MVEIRRCRECGADVPRAHVRGRPPVYCSKTCRRLAEFRIRRVNRQLDALETQLAYAQHARWYGTAKGRQKWVTELEALVRAAEARLRELLEAVP